jgi:hypothetical protein
MSRAIKKRIEVEFLQWTGENHRPMFDFLTEYKETDKHMTAFGDNFLIDHTKGKGGLCIDTSEGMMFANIGDYIIKEPFDKERKFYPCKEEIFKQTYDILPL